MGDYFIRRGAVADADACYRIAIAQPRGTLPKLLRVNFVESAERGELHVAERNGDVVGFARFHARRDGWHTLYDLAVHPDHQRAGMGRSLLYSVPVPVRLKCPATSAANTFYHNAGMIHVGQDGDLNLYERHILTIFCQGGNHNVVEAARRSGMAYGVRSDYPAYDYPFMVDVPFEDFDWSHHYEAISAHRPVFALALDYESPDQREIVLGQIRAIQALGVLRVGVCVKFDSAIADIPLEVVICISVPSGYAGFIASDIREYRGRKLHLLGGTPQQWLELIPKLRGVGATVVSVDGSSHETGSKKGSHWDAETLKWTNKGKAADYLETMAFSGRNITRLLNRAVQTGNAQPLLEPSP